MSTKRSTPAKGSKGKRAITREWRELAFVRGVLEGLSQTEAARRAGYTGTDEIVASSASRLAARESVRNEIARQRAILEAKSTMTREARLAAVEEIITNPRTEPRDRLKALELRARMGADFVERRQIEGAVQVTGPVRVEVTLSVEQAREEARRGIEHGTATATNPQPAGAPPGPAAGAAAGWTDDARDAAGRAR